MHKQVYCLWGFLFLLAACLFVLNEKVNSFAPRSGEPAAQRGVKVYSLYTYRNPGQSYMDVMCPDGHMFVTSATTDGHALLRQCRQIEEDNADSVEP